MKSVYGVVLLATLFALAHGFPGAARESVDSDEDKSGPDGLVLVVPSFRVFEDSKDDDDDSGFWHPFRFETSPFDGLFTRMQEAMNRIRAEMATALASRLGQGQLTPWGKVPEGANTTSTTKIIGDHSVTINETTYSDGDENGGTVFRIRVVDVKPLNETTSDTIDTEKSDDSDEESTPTRRITTTERNNEEREELTTPGSRSVETVEEFDNEIPKSQVDTLTA